MNDTPHTNQVPNGSFTPADQSAVQVYTADNLKSVLEQLVANFSTALTIDRQEVENAKASADGPLCSDGYDAEGTAAIFLKAEQDMCRNLDTLVGSPVISGMSAGFPEGFGPSGGPGLAGAWMDTADAPINNQNPYDGWHKAMTDLHKIVEDSQATKTASWQGDAGDAYRQDAGDRTAEAVSLESLARNSRDALDALVSVQATVIDAIIDEFDKKLGIPGMSSFPEATTVDVFQDKGDSKWDAESFQFYTRTCGVNALVREIIDFMNILNGSEQKWIEASEQIGVTLQEAVESARQNQTNDGTYNGETEVDEGNGVCYNPGGVGAGNSLL